MKIIEINEKPAAEYISIANDNLMNADSRDRELNFYIRPLV
jgi:hypothetical protein